MNTQGITARVETITPDQASVALDKLAHQRPLSRGLVARLVADILAGRFILNGEPIIFSSSGELLDGMHRMYAIYEAGVPVQVLVVRGVPFEAFKTIDTGKPRSFSDMIKINGGAVGDWSEKRLASAITAMATNGRSLNNVGGTMGDLMVALTKYDYAIRSLSDQGSLVSSHNIVPSFVVGATMAAATMQPDVADQGARFLQSLLTGVIDNPRSGGSALVSLRNLILTNSLSGASHRHEYYVKSQRAFRAFLSSEQCSRLYAPERPLWDVSVGSEWWNFN